MPSVTINIKHMRKCAFCKYWNDPTNSAIVPKAPATGLWEIKDVNQKCLCLKENIPMAANAFCSRDYAGKIL